MLRLKEGDAVRVVDRAPTPADLRSGLFFNHFRNLNGTVFKLYGIGETQQAAIEVIQESLPEEVTRRHQEISEQMSAQMPRDAKRGTENGQSFQLRYVILVSVSDLMRRSSKPGRTAD